MEINTFSSGGQKNTWRDEEPAEEKKPRSFWKTWLVGLVAVMIIMSAFLGFFTSFILSRFSVFEVLFTLNPAQASMQEMNILLLGVDATAGTKRSDTIMVIRVDPKTKTISLVSIPRDTMVVIPGVRFDKINHAYAFGGPELAVSTTANFLNIPLKHYIKVNVDKFEQLIDRLGGIYVDVDQRMYYVDYAGGLFIDLKPGRQKLSGKQAIGYLRFRHDARGDFGRVQRQQQFIQEVARELAKTKNVVQIYQLLLDLMNSVETNLSSSQIFTLASLVRQAYEIGNIRATSLPGTSTRIDGIYYLQPDMGQINKIVNSYLREKPEIGGNQEGPAQTQE